LLDALLSGGGERVTGARLSTSSVILKSENTVDAERIENPRGLEPEDRSGKWFSTVASSFSTSAGDMMDWGAKSWAGKIGLLGMWSDRSSSQKEGAEFDFGVVSHGLKWDRCASTSERRLKTDWVSSSRDMAELDVESRLELENNLLRLVENWLALLLDTGDCPDSDVEGKVVKPGDVDGRTDRGMGGIGSRGWGKILGLRVPLSVLTSSGYFAFEVEEAACVWRDLRELWEIDFFNVCGGHLESAICAKLMTLSASDSCMFPKPFPLCWCADCAGIPPEGEV
jgi:hypothetical protein